MPRKGKNLFVPQGYQELGSIQRTHCKGQKLVTLVNMRRGKVYRWRCKECRVYMEKP